MLIVLLDEPGLFVFRNAADAEREIEAPDADSIIRAAFDERGVPYRVEWLDPNSNKLHVRSGMYRFVPAGPPDVRALIHLLDAHPDFTNPPAAQAELSLLLSRLRAAVP